MATVTITLTDTPDELVAHIKSDDEVNPMAPTEAQQAAVLCIETLKASARQVEYSKEGIDGI